MAEDTIVAVDGNPVQSPSQLSEIIQQVGGQLDADRDVVRGGQTVKADIR